MYGAFIGDIIGSKYEFDNIKTKNFPLFSPECDFTDDTIMTVADAYLPAEFKDIAMEFHRVCVDRIGTYGRSGFCSRFLSEEEYRQYNPPFF